MELNSNKFFLRGVYSYDISACNYNMLCENRETIENIVYDDKTKRNIQIGYLSRDIRFNNESLRSSVEKTVDTFLSLSRVNNSDIIIRQFDGVLLKKKIDYTAIGFNAFFDFRDTYNIFVASLDKQMYIAKTDKNEIISKGIPNNYDGLSPLYDMILSLNFANKSALFSGLKELYNFILTSEDIELFLIPTDDSHSEVVIEKYGKIEISNTVTTLLASDEIDRKWYFDKYIKPFTQSISYEFI